MKIEAVGNGDPWLEWCRRRQAARESIVGARGRCWLTRGMKEESAWIRQLISERSYGPWAMRSSELAGTARSVCGTRPPNGCSGFTADEALGRSLDLIIPERFRNRHWERYQQVMRTGQTKYGTEVLRVPALHKDKRTLSIAFTVALLCSPDN